MSMKYFRDKIIEGDCLEVCIAMPKKVFDLVYLDPPFFSGKDQQSKTRDGTRHFSFSDRWPHLRDYADFMGLRIEAIRPLLKDTGSIIVHCDSSANYVLRAILEDVFGSTNFRSEIIWRYKRWSNSQRTPIPSHQTLLFYSASDNYKYNQIFGDYSATTNVDQILQSRARDGRGKSVYARDPNGEIIGSGSKNGVPLADVWDIPFLNPKAKERVGYPTQKPLLLLERVLELLSDPGDWIFDPFCGSGTTLVSAKILNRHFTGIDLAADAVSLTRERLSNPVMTESNLLKKGEEAYLSADSDALNLLSGLPVVPIQRNKGIDALLNGKAGTDPVLIRVQRPDESIMDTIGALRKASRNKKYSFLVIVATEASLVPYGQEEDDLIIVESTAKTIQALSRSRAHPELRLFDKPNNA